ncbi:CAP domain-containing protein [Sulfitobacter sp. F26169L]|uniref:CAP domain-containing protein n=1 Tax=Sulfitobacter sp. F26169L TaxID=2996015 RepID=UPI002260E6E0|nr:CAP domain-containing protein [Sulfitobacter sp. F26169L]MCX7565921.1 CAP domain-containing protein [Sulfitobacter sp. F26169L]
MIRSFTLLLVAVVGLSACQPAAPRMGTDGRPVPTAYKISHREAEKIPFRMLDSVNTLRSASALTPLTLNAQLTAAAATHSRDMQVQNRPWHFGSDGSSPVDRVQRVGYAGTLVGEVISETYESELETLGAWMSQPDTRRIIMSPDARQMGFSWFQEDNGKIWWTLVLGS